MSKEIVSLSPGALWENFYKVTQIPRPSKKEERIQEFILNFGRSLGLETKIDEVGNILIRKPATPGMENRKGIILQGHLDMVPQKNSGTKHDFEKDPIEAYVDGEWVKARGTTLGADNGIGVAAAMAVLESKDIEHGPIEALFTCDEETGMTGAFGLKEDWLEGEILLNMDSEDEGELYVGCAGGVNANAEFEYDELVIPEGVVPLKLNISGLKGGHSGLDIILGRGNANKILFRFLKIAVREFDARLSEISAGDLRNAIPREGYAVILVPSDSVEALKSAVSGFEATVKSELALVEPDLKFTVEETGMPSSVMDEVTQDDLIDAINVIPNGVIRMSDDMPGMVETSSNLAIVKSEEGIVKVQCLIRSSVESAKKDVIERLESLFTLAGSVVLFDGEYPGWKPDMESQVLKIMKDVYKKMYDKVPEVKGIHAGLECGLLGSVYPRWDMISFGPTIRFPHSPDEKVNIASVGKFWDFLIETIRNAPVK